MTAIKRIRLFLELLFLLAFSYYLFSLTPYHQTALRICLNTLFIVVAFAVVLTFLDKKIISTIFSPTVLFYIGLSITQTIKNIAIPSEMPAFVYEGIHYILTSLILIYNRKPGRMIKTGLILFLVYSFRIFDTGFAEDEFIFIHALTFILALTWLETNPGKEIAALRMAVMIYWVS